MVYVSQCIKEENFMEKLLMDIWADKYNLSDDDMKTRKFLTLREHLTRVNNQMQGLFSERRLIEIEQSIKEAVVDITNLNEDIYLPTGVVVLAEYLTEPKDMFVYERL